MDDVTVKRGRKPKAKRPYNGSRNTSHLKLWNDALKQCGFLKKGENKKVPTKGSPEYSKVREAYEKLKSENNK